MFKKPVIVFACLIGAVSMVGCGRSKPPASRSAVPDIATEEGSTAPPPSMPPPPPAANPAAIAPPAQAQAVPHEPSFRPSSEDGSSGVSPDYRLQRAAQADAARKEIEQRAAQLQAKEAQGQQHEEP